MSIKTAITSQINNIRNFSVLFPASQLARNALTFPLDYVGMSGRAGPPMVINLLLTSRCDMNCKMCSVKNFREEQHRELTPDDLERIVRQTLPFRPTFFFGGGEPFVRRDVVEMIRVVKKYGLPLGMVSNGMSVSPEIGEAVKEAGLDQIIFSLHGPRDIHREITQVPGGYDRIVKNIKAFTKGPRKTRVMMNVVPSGENVGHIPEMVALGRELGVDQVRIEHLVFLTERELSAHHSWCQANLPDEYRDKLDVNAHICNYAELSERSGEIARVVRQVKEEHGDFVMVKPWLDDREIEKWYAEGHVNNRHCYFVWRSLFIDPEGYVFPCLFYTDMKFGNVLDEPITRIWNSRRYRDFRLTIRRQLLPGCARCCRL